MFSMAERAAVAVGPNVRRERNLVGVTLRELAARIGVSVGTMSAIENDKVSPTLMRLQEIADELQIPIKRLLSGPVADSSPPAPDPAATDAGAWREFAPLSVDPVLRSAIDVFTETGYHAATMRMIADGAGISVAGVYHHYRSKQSLLVAIFELIIEEVQVRLIRARDEGGADPVERYSNMVEALALYYVVRSDIAVVGTNETRSLEEPAAGRIAAERRGMQDLMDTELDRAAAAGAVVHPRPHTTARAVTTMCAALPQWFDPTGPLSPEQIAQEYAGHARAMLGMRPAYS